MSTERKTTRREALGILALGTIGVTVGCGGSGSESAGRKATVRLKVSWPSQPVTRYLPTYAASLFFELYLKSDPNKRTSLVVNRPTTLPAEQDVAFSGLYVEGDYVLAGAARVLADGQGASVATGTTEVAVRSGMSPVALTLGTTLRRLEIVGLPLSATVGVKRTLVSGAFDPDNRSLLLPGGALVWRIVSGTAATITSAGELTPTAAGVVRVRVAETGAGVSAEADVTVTVQQVALTLATTAWPKDSGDAANTGRGTGRGAIGVQKWVYDFGEPPAGSGSATFRIYGGPTVGDGLVYATDTYGNTAALRVADGTAAWRVSSDFRNAYATPLLLSDNTLVTGGNNGGLFGLDGLTGLEKWRNATPSLVALNFSAQKKIVATESNSVGFYNPATGTPESGGNSAIRPGSVAVGPDGTLYFTAVNSFNTELRAYDPASGSVRWSKILSQNSTSSAPVVGSDNTVYFFGNKNDGTAFVYLFAFDGATGAVKYERKLGGGQLAIASDGTLFAAADGKILSLAADLTTRWEKALDRLSDDNFARADRVIVGGDGTLYATTIQNYADAPNYVVALSGADGSQKWRFDYVGVTFGGMALGGDGTLYVAANFAAGSDSNNRGRIYAIG